MLLLKLNRLALLLLLIRFFNRPQNKLLFLLKSELSLLLSLLLRSIKRFKYC
jgi:hypothetical protein